MTAILDHAPLAWSFRPGPLPAIEAAPRRPWWRPVLFWSMLILASMQMALPVWIALAVAALIHRRWWTASVIAILVLPIG